MSDMKSIKEYCEKNKTYIIYAILCIVSLLMTLSLSRYGSEKLIDSDSSSELILAKLSAAEGSFISKNWYYPTELRVISAQLIYTPLAKIFNDWSIWRFVSIIISTILFIGTYLFFTIKVKSKGLFIKTMPILFVAFSWDYFYEMYLGLFYVPYVIIAFLTFSLLFVAYGRKNSILAVFLNGILAIFAGMAGLREIILLYFPAFAAVLLMAAISYFRKDNTKDKLNKYLRIGIYSFINLVCSGIGFLINILYLSKEYSFMIWNNKEWKEFDINACMNVVNGFFKTFGYSTGEIGINTLIKNSVSIIFVIIGFISISIVLKKKEAIIEHYFVACFTLVAISIFLMIYTFTNMDYTDRYNIPIVIMFIPVMFFALENIHISNKIKEIIVIGMCLICCLSSAISVNEYKKCDKTIEFENMKGILESRNYLYGIANFGDCNILTEVSDGKIDMRCLGDWTGDMSECLDVTATYNWLAEKRHTGEIPKGKVFIIFRTVGFDTFYAKEQLENIEPLYLSDEYRVVGFDSYENLLKTLSDYEMTFKGENEWVQNGHDTNGKRILQKEGISYGPYRTLYAGDYVVTYKGSNLENAEVDCVSGENALEIKNVRKENKIITYELSLKNTVTGVETRIFNKGMDDLQLNSISIQKQ